MAPHWDLGYHANDLMSSAVTASYFGPTPTAFGHGGAGGQLGFCDAVRQVGFGFVQSQLEPHWRATASLTEALYACRDLAARPPKQVNPCTTRAITSPARGSEGWAPFDPNGVG